MEINLSKVKALSLGDRVDLLTTSAKLRWGEVADRANRLVQEVLKEYEKVRHLMTLLQFKQNLLNSPRELHFTDLKA